MKWVYKKRLLIGLFFVCIILLLRYLGVGNYMTLDTIKSNRKLIQNMIEQNYWMFVFSFLGVYILGVAMFLPIAILLNLAGGFFFGTVHGALLSNVAATIGSIISFLLIRYFFGKGLHARYKERLRAFNKELRQYGYSYLLSIHFFFIIPLFVPNILAGLANIPLWTFIWTTAFGLIPGMFVFSFTGRQLMTMQSLKDLFSLNLILIVLGLFLLSLAPFIPRWFKMAKRRITKIK